MISFGAKPNPYIIITRRIRKINNKIRKINNKMFGLFNDLFDFCDFRSFHSV